jgi:hypothetical protein
MKTKVKIRAEEMSHVAQTLASGFDFLDLAN